MKRKANKAIKQWPIIFTKLVSRGSCQVLQVVFTFAQEQKTETAATTTYPQQLATAQTASCRYKCILRCVRGDSSYVGVSLCRCYCCCYCCCCSCCCLFADVFWLIIYLVGALPLHVACQTRLF